MPRRCVSCGATTPPQNVQSCPACGHQFNTQDNTTASGPATYRGHPTTHRGGGGGGGHGHHSKPCEYKSICAEYLRSLGWSTTLFDRRFNHCYCPNCYNTTSSDTVDAAGSTYVIPRGWCRFGLQVDRVRSEVDHIWRNWIVTYHGTTPEAAESIVVHRQFLIPGDKRLDGDVIAIRPGHIEGKNEIYTSPTIAYSSHPVYCRAHSFRSPTTNKNYKAYVVLQCRQDPASSKVQPETIGAGTKRICPIIPNDKVEIFTTVRASVLPYGILIRVQEA